MGKMSMKRQATSELNAENWDQDEPADDDVGSFKPASKDIIERRVIRTAKRRIHASTADNKKSAFSGFQGFKKPQPSSFDFLANLTNGTKTTTNGSPMTTSSASLMSSSLFGTKQATSTPSSGLFQIPTNVETSEVSQNTTNIFGPAIKPSVFQSPSNIASPNLGSIFSTPKEDISTEQSSFKILSPGPTTVSNNFLTPLKSNTSTGSNSSVSPVKTNASTTSNNFLAPVRTNVFPTSNPLLIQNTSPIFTATAGNNQSVSPKNTSLSNFANNLNTSGNSFTGSPKKHEYTSNVNLEGKHTKDENTAAFYSKLACLNKAVTQWIKKHVEDTPLCILTPIFKDYEKYLKELQTKYGIENIESELDSDSKSKAIETEPKKSNGSGWPLKSIGANLVSNPSSKSLDSTSLFNSKPANTISNIAVTSAVSESVRSNANATASITAPNFLFVASQSTGMTKAAPTFPFGVNNSIPNTSTAVETTGTFTLPAKTSNVTASSPTTSTFSFGVNNSVTTSAPCFPLSTKSFDTTTSGSFSFGIPTSTTTVSTTSTVFSLATKTPVCTSSPAFSFGIPTTNVPTTSTSKFSFTPTTAASTLPASFSFGTTTTATPTSSTFSFSPKSVTTTSSPFSINVTSASSVTNSSPTFSFTTKTPSQVQSSTTASPFSFNMNTPVNTMAGSQPFSFGTGKPFSFKIENKVESESQAEKEENEEPPKVEFTPVVEENSIYEKRCKVFVKKDKNFVDKGIGTLYIKKIDESGKHQLLIRANTNLGTIVVNVILSKSMQIQRMGKNNVMMVCIPTPDTDPPPVPILIRVKTLEEADELSETLNKYAA